MKFTINDVFDKKNKITYYYLCLHISESLVTDDEAEIAKFLELDYPFLIKIMHKYNVFYSDGLYFFYEHNKVEKLIKELEPYLIMKKLK